MYSLLAPKELDKFFKTIFVVYHDDGSLTTSQTDRAFNIFIGGLTKHIDKAHPIMTGFYAEQDKILLIKNLVCPVKGKLTDDLGSYRAFCTMVIKEFLSLAKSRSMKSLIIHTDDLIMLEELLDYNFRIVSTTNNFYRALKLTNI